MMSGVCSVAIISRVILAMFWFAIQTVNGGDVVQVMITAIWPSFARLPNHIPADQGITTAQMVSFFLCKRINSLMLAECPPLLYLEADNMAFCSQSGLPRSPSSICILIIFAISSLPSPSSCLYVSSLCSSGRFARRVVRGDRCSLLRQRLRWEARRTLMPGFRRSRQYVYYLEMPRRKHMLT